MNATWLRIEASDGRDAAVWRHVMGPASGALAALERRAAAWLATQAPDVAPTAEEMVIALGLPPTQASASAAGYVLRRLGRTPHQRREGGVRVRRYVRARPTPWWEQTL